MNDVTEAVKWVRHAAFKVVRALEGEKLPCRLRKDLKELVDLLVCVEDALERLNAKKEAAR